MGFGEKFRSTYGTGQRYRAFEAADRARLEGVVPDYLVELWTADGWAGYRGGLLWTVDPQELEPVVRQWKLPDGPILPIARTAFGKLYLLEEFVAEDGWKGLSTVELDPHTGGLSVVGPSAERFLTEGLAKSRYVEKALREAEVVRAVRDVGTLSWDEMYGYEPALALGGSGKPETVRRYNLFDHHLLLSQLVEVKLVEF